MNFMTIIKTGAMILSDGMARRLHEPSKEEQVVTYSLSPYIHKNTIVLIVAIVSLPAQVLTFY